MAITGDRDIVCPNLELANITSSAGTPTHLYEFGQLSETDVSIYFGVIPSDAATKYPTWGPTYASHTGRFV